jgi:hypothetical protein
MHSVTPLMTSQVRRSLKNPNGPLRTQTSLLRSSGNDQGMIITFEDMRLIVLEHGNQLLKANVASTDMLTLNERIKRSGHVKLHPLHPLATIIRKKLTFVAGCNGQTLHDSFASPLKVTDLVTLLESLHDYKFEAEFLAAAQGAGELAVTVLPVPLQAWLKSSIADDEELHRFLNLSQWMHSCLGDESEFGYFSNVPEAQLLRSLTKGLPVVLDYVASCSVQEQDAFSTTMMGLSRTFSARGASGIIAPLFDQADHGSMVLFLTFVRCFSLSSSQLPLATNPF